MICFPSSLQKPAHPEKPMINTTPESLYGYVSKMINYGLDFKFFRQNLSEYHLLRSYLDIVVSPFLAEELDPDSATQLHTSLNAIYQCQIGSSSKISQFDPILMEIMCELENAWLFYEKKRAPDRDLPSDSREFIRWMKTFVLQHPSTEHRLFKFLANVCSFRDMAYFFSQEVTIDPRFSDLISFMQIGLENQSIQLELAENYWDEMGNGDVNDMHVHMFSDLFKELLIFQKDEQFNHLISQASWQSLACGNSLLHSVLHRNKFRLALGSIGTVEIISPVRFSYLIKGFERLKLSEKAKRYHKTHINIDSRHGNAWLHGAILPTVQHDPEARHDIYRGAMLRLNTSLDYCNHLSQVLES
jgi:hypothetical protein